GRTSYLGTVLEHSKVMQSVFGVRAIRLTHTSNAFILRSHPPLPLLLRFWPSWQGSRAQGCGCLIFSYLSRATGHERKSKIAYAEWKRLRDMCKAWTRR